MDDEQKFLRFLRIKRRRAGKEPIAWEGVGRFGMVGWSICVPILLGLLLGWWLDKRTEDSHFWTTALLFTGLIFGCVNTAYWLFKAYDEMKEPRR